MSWLVADAALFARWLDIRRVRTGFAIWFCTNVAWAAYDFAHGLPVQGALMSVYALLAVWGWCEWGKRHA